MCGSEPLSLDSVADAACGVWSHRLSARSWWSHPVGGMPGGRLWGLVARERPLGVGSVIASALSRWGRALVDPDPPGGGSPGHAPSTQLLVLGAPRMPPRHRHRSPPG